MVGFPAGGATDVTARVIAESLHKSLGRAVVVENKPGATGIVAARELGRAAPDGNTLLVTPLFVPVLAPLTFHKLDYDPARDMIPIGQVVKSQHAFAVPANHPAHSMPEFVAWAKANRTRG